jgi:hypothetical protein
MHRARRLGDPKLPLNRGQQQHPAIRGQPTAGKPGKSPLRSDMAAGTSLPRGESGLDTRIMHDFNRLYSARRSPHAAR